MCPLGLSCERYLKHLGFWFPAKQVITHEMVGMGVVGAALAR